MDSHPNILPQYMHYALTVVNIELIGNCAE